MIHPAHLHFSLHAPQPGGLRYKKLFTLMDKLKPTVLDELLIDLYIAYVPDDEKYDPEAPKPKPGSRYPLFKKTFVAANKGCSDESFVVFGLVSYILAESYRKSDYERFERIIG